MRFRTGTIAILFMMLGLAPCAAGAKSLDDIKNAKFGETGIVKRVNCPIGGRYDCISFPSNLYELNDTCFTLEPGSLLVGYEDALMLQFRSGGLAIMVKTGFSSDKFEIMDIQKLYNCPTSF